MFSKFTAPNLDLSNFVAGSRVDTTQMFNGHNVASQIVVNDQKIKK